MLPADSLQHVSQPVWRRGGLTTWIGNPAAKLVDLLKMPTCFGEARKVVLKHLGNRYGRTFANHREFVRYAKEQRLDVDFATAPSASAHFPAALQQPHRPSVWHTQR